MSVNPQKAADDLLSTYDKRKALIEKAQRNDSNAMSHTWLSGRKRSAVEVRQRKVAFEARKAAREL